MSSGNMIACETCDGRGKIEVKPQIAGWKYLGGLSYLMPNGKQFTFTPEMRGVVIVDCPSCTVLAT